MYSVVKQHASEIDMPMCATCAARIKRCYSFFYIALQR